MIQTTKIKKITAQLKTEMFITDILLNGGEVFMVGGCVRDSLLDKDPKDIDLLVRLLEFESLVQILKVNGKVTLTDVGDKFGVIKFIPTGSKQDFDIALPRTEELSEVIEGRNSFEVNSDCNLSVESDLKRRDFTINAIAFDIKSGLLIDPFDGIIDLELKLIRMVNPKAFADDPLRMLRGVQFVSRFDGFHFDMNTRLEIRKNARSIKTITGERIKDEIQKIFDKGNIESGLINLIETGLQFHLFENFITGISNIKTESDFWFTVCNSEEFQTKLKGETKMVNEIKMIEILMAVKGDNVSTATRLIAGGLKKSNEFVNSGILQCDGSIAVKLGLLEFHNTDPFDRLPFSIKEVKITSEELMLLGFKGQELGDLWKEIFIAIHEREIININTDILHFVHTKI